MSYFSSITLIVVVILLAWSLILTYKERARKTTSRSRLAKLRRKVEALPEETDEERSAKETLHRELYLEYFDNILGEIEKMQATLAKKTQDSRKAKGKSKSR